MAALCPPFGDVAMNMTPAQLRMKDAIVELCEKERAEMTVALGTALKLGDFLHRLKGSMNHGLWEDFVRAELPISTRTASDRIRLAGNRAAVEAMLANQQSTADLSIAGALKALTKSTKSTKSEKSGKSTHQDGGAGDVEGSGEEAASPGERKEASPAAAFTDTPGRALAADAKLHDEIVAAFGRRDEFKQRMSAVSALKVDVARLAREDPVWASITPSQWEADCSNIHNALRFAMPHAICPWCDGNGCEPGLGCKGRGWVHEGLWKAAPRALREKTA